MNDDYNDDDDEQSESIRLKGEGMSLAADAQDRHDNNWKPAVLATIHAVAVKQLYLDAEDVRAHGVQEPRHFNAWGSAWKTAVEKGWIDETIEQPRRNSKRPQAHGAKMTRYKSRICKVE